MHYEVMKLIIIIHIAISLLMMTSHGSNVLNHCNIKVVLTRVISIKSSAHSRRSRIGDSVQTKQ